MDSTRKIKVIVVLISFSIIGLFAQTNSVQNREKRVKMPKKVFRATNLFLSKRNVRPLSPCFQPTWSNFEFRIVVVDEKLVQPEKINFYITLFTLNLDDDLYTQTCRVHLEKMCFSDKNDQPTILFSTDERWTETKIRKWFELLRKTEIFNLPASEYENPIADDRSVHAPPFDHFDRAFYIEKSTSDEYVLISRIPAEGFLAVDAVLTRLHEWFPNVDLPMPKEPLFHIMQ